MEDFTGVVIGFGLAIGVVGLCWLAMKATDWWWHRNNVMFDPKQGVHRVANPQTIRTL